jgi:hypothetical protein
MRLLAALAVVVSLVACDAAPQPTASAGPGTIVIEVRAGPACPVETTPPDPACAPRPVAGVRILLQPGDGRDIVVAETVSDEDGMARVDVPAGEYLVIGTDVEGLFGRPDPVLVAVEPGEIAEVALGYDTGIR